MFLHFCEGGSGLTLSKIEGLRPHPLKNREASPPPSDREGAFGFKSGDQALPVTPALAATPALAFTPALVVAPSRSCN
ncbi:hypothetical protein Vi05172_g11574 [Venturia inaequalis]|nr:hypothetical protein Vi05172_g11574 [Venturia inaequalis]